MTPNPPILPPESSNQLAIKAIQCLQRAIRDEFGLKIRIGGELEFCAYATGNLTRGTRNNPLNISDVAKNPSGKTPAERARWLPEYLRPASLDGRAPPFISTFYKEGRDNKYEVTFGHMTQHDRTGETISPVLLARAVEKTRSSFVRDAHNHGVEVHFAPIAPIPDSTGLVVTNGMQINVSFVNRIGKRLFGKAQNSDTHIMDYLVNRALEIQQETVLLHAPTPESYDRFKPRSEGTSPTHFSSDENGSFIARTQFVPSKKKGVSSPKDQKLSTVFTNHVENRLAGADANPYHVTLATLAALYYGLRDERELSFSDGKGQLVRIDHKPVTLGLLPSSREEAISSFEHNHLFRSVLNEVSGEQRLGDRFCNSVLTEIRTGVEKEALILTR